MEGFKDYHKIIRAYSGTGNLSLHGGDEMRSYFRLVQYADGSLRLDCLIPPDGILQIAPERTTPLLIGTPGVFSGQTDEGLIVNVERAFLIGQRFGLEARRAVEGAPGPEEEGHVHYEHELALDVTHAVVGREGNVSFRWLRYGLTNLDFEPSEWATISSANPPIPEAQQLPLDLDGLKVALRPVADYDAIIGALAFTHGVDVTCDLLVPVESLEGTSGPEALVELDRKVDDLCTLLTLATGTRVNRYGLDFVGEDGEVKTSFLQRAITARYKPHPFPSPVADEHLKPFVEAAFPRLVPAGEQWSLPCVVESYIDARDSGLLSATGVKLAVCVEVLKAQFLKRAKLKDYLMPEKLFDRALKKQGLRDKLRAALRESLGEARPTSEPDTSSKSSELALDDEELDAVVDVMVSGGKLKELNRRAFGDVLREMCAEVKMEASDEERERFVKIRNLLVHQGVFPESLGDPQQQCRFLDDFVGRFLLAALGYASQAPADGEAEADGPGEAAG